ncbi:MAG: hypothetical protein LIO80_07355 [Lachnospiraceae bacterium]|nr:hypothetical protein [Lachnospiraceae bacterium]
MYSEKTLRRRAHKIGYQVVKGRRNYVSDRNGFMILNPVLNCVVRGTIDGLTFCMDVDDVEDFLKDEYESLGLSW